MYSTSGISALGSAVMRIIPLQGLRLKRTFNQFGIRFWRVVGPLNSPSLNSDLSFQGLLDWKLIRGISENVNA